MVTTTSTVALFSEKVYPGSNNCQKVFFLKRYGIENSVLIVYLEISNNIKKKTWKMTLLSLQISAIPEGEVYRTGYDIEINWKRNLCEEQNQT